MSDPLRPAGPDAPTDPSTPLAGLCLDEALALLHHAGIDGPMTAPCDAAGLQRLIDALVALSSRDALTGIANRRSFELALVREIDRVARTAEPALLLLVDIDHFKRVNDTHGHPAGDAVIRTVARALADSIRPMDLVARLGGEEFGLLLPNCPPAFAPQIAERVRQRLARADWPQSGGQRLSVTVSVGGAYAPRWVRSTPALWLARADLQLYRAKSEGRDRACFEAAVSSDVSVAERELLLGGLVAPHVA